MKVTYRSKKIVVHQVFQYVYIEGIKFELYDLCSTLEHAASPIENIEITNDRMAKVLLEKKLITNRGSARHLTPARLTQKGKDFLACLKKRKQTIWKKDKKKN